MQRRASRKLSWRLIGLALVPILAGPWGALRAQVPRFAYVANTNSSDVSAYTIDPVAGSLTPIDGSPFPARFHPGPVTVDPTGRFALVATIMGPEGGFDRTVAAYDIDPATGALTPAPGSPFIGRQNSRSVTVHPSGKFAYVGTGCCSQFFGYAIDPTTGALTPVPGSPFLIAAVEDRVAIHPTGRFLFAGAGDFVFGLAIDPDTGTLTLRDSVVEGLGATENSTMTLDPTGRFIFSVNVNNPDTGDVQVTLGAVSIDPVSGGLTLVPGSPFPVIGFGSLTVDAAGRFAYLNYGTIIHQGIIQVFSINQDVGALTEIAGSPFPTGAYPLKVVLDPSGRFAYVPNRFSNNVSAYTVDATTGALTPVTGSPFPAGVEPVSLTIDPTGQFMYVANSASNNVSAYIIDPDTGALGEVVGSPFPAGIQPQSVTITAGP